VKSQKKHATCLRVAQIDAHDRVFTQVPAAAPAKAIGIIGGIFDPVHNGHLAIAQLACDYFGLKKIVFIPSGNPPHKAPPVASVKHRCFMLRTALRGHSHFTLWDGEVRRKGASYTIDTLHLFSKEYPDRPLYFIIGSDNLPEIATWRRYEEILGLVTLCVAGRPGYSTTVPRSLASARILFFPSPLWGISSSMLRDYFQRGYSCRHLVPPQVLEYISRHKLYS
jgi:nicotinate-nucleotide adenylyltransferase